MKYSNYHTHTLFCDGKDTPEELVLRAIELGCPEIGFSGHACMPFDNDWAMTHRGTEEYIETVTRLKEKYRSRIRILLGIEQDYFSEESTDGYDYVIGGVHCIRCGDVYLDVDNTPEILRDGVDRYFSGDYLAFCEEYYRLVADLYNRTGCDIVAHLDLVTKFNEGDRLFDSSSPTYRRAALSALDSLCKSPVKFEINTGAISRGYRTEPYPAPFLISEIKARGASLILSSDCHARENLLLGFDKYSYLL